MLNGPANCKKTTRHHAHLSLCAKSNDGKLMMQSRENGQKPQFPNFFWKIVLIQIEGHI